MVMGQVLQAGSGQNSARQAAIAAGLPQEVPAITLNNVCLSSLTAVALADQMIRSGELDVVVAGGMESMSNAPYLLSKARWGARIGNGEDGRCDDPRRPLVDFHRSAHGGVVGRGERDAGHLSGRSGRLGSALTPTGGAARESGRFAEEIVPVQVEGSRAGNSTAVEDEGIRPGTTVPALTRLRPAFSEDGTITAGNASQLADGAAAVVVISLERAAGLGLEPLAEIVAYGMCAGRFAYLHTVPATALKSRLGKDAIDIDDLGLSRSTKRSRRSRYMPTACSGAAKSRQCQRQLGRARARARLDRRTDDGDACPRAAPTRLEYGGATFCGGGGQGYALVLRRPSTA